MFFKRRELLISTGLFLIAGILPKLKGGKTVSLNNKKFHIVEPDSRLFLPNGPKNGQTINLIIPRQSVQNPSKLIFSKNLILGDKEDLVLDSFGQIRLTFVNDRVGWANLPT